MVIINNNNKYLYKAQKTKGFYALYMAKHNVQYQIHTFKKQFRRHSNKFMKMFFKNLPPLRDIVIKGNELFHKLPHQYKHKNSHNYTKD